MFIAKRLIGDQITQSILPSVECCSEIEQDDDGYYQSRDVEWMSPAYSALMVALDHHTISYLEEFKGKNRAKKSAEYNKGRNGTTPYNKHPCRSLPSNCFGTKYLYSLYHTDRVALMAKNTWAGLEKTVLHLFPQSLIHTLPPELRKRVGKHLNFLAL